MLRYEKSQLKSGYGRLRRPSKTSRTSPATRSTREPPIANCHWQSMPQTGERIAPSRAPITSQSPAATYLSCPQFCPTRWRATGATTAKVRRKP
jgi:hypothetical protein